MKLPADLATYYDADYWEGRKIYHDTHGQTACYHGPGLVWAGFDAVRDGLFRLLMPESLLDVACGGGDFVRRARLAGVSAYGFDASPHAVEHAGNDLQACVFLGNALDPTPYDDAVHRNKGPFDLVTAFDALEHFYAKDLPTLLRRLGGVARRHLAFCIGNSGASQVHMLEEGQDVPAEHEGMHVSGHVTIQTFDWWLSVIRGALPGFTPNWRSMYQLQVNFVTDHRIHGADGRPMQAWGPDHMIIMTRQ